MSTTIKEIKGRYEVAMRKSHNLPEYLPSTLSLTRFFGGKKKGAMLQITIHGGYSSSYVQLTQKQVKKLAKVLQDSFDYSKYPSD